MMRRLPLSPGFKTTLTSMPFTVGQTAAKELDLTVAGIEAIQVTAGKFNCFKITFGAIGQTFWIGVDRGRPLVKLQSGNVEAELTKVWGPENILDSALSALPAGWRVQKGSWDPGNRQGAYIDREVTPGNFGWGANVIATKIYTPPADIPKVLHEAVQKSIRNDKYSVRPESIQPRLIGGRQAISWWLDLKEPTSPWLLRSFHRGRWRSRPCVSSRPPARSDSAGHHAAQGERL
jgi:hypothetical protein